MGRWSCDIIIWWITKKNGALALMLLLATLLQVLGKQTISREYNFNKT